MRDALLGNGNTLGCASAAGGVDQVRRVMRPQRRGAVAIGGRTVAGNPPDPGSAVSTRFGPRVRRSCNASRSAGYSGSSGRYAAPAFSVPTIATTISTERSIEIATMSSGPIPSAIRLHASWFARASSSA